MPTYKTPNVYVEEQSLLPNSVAEVSTAIPAFIGYTAKAAKGATDLTNVPTRITTLLEYEELFGGAELSTFTVSVTGGVVDPITAPGLTNLMYHCLRMYFDNGGGPCYIVSTGAHKAAGGTPDITELTAGLTALEKEDEPTLILPVDAVNLGAADYATFCQKALTQCGTLKDRFALFDIQSGDDSQVGDQFRNDIGQNYLKYGAAYYPNLLTNLGYSYDDTTVSVNDDGVTANLGDSAIKDGKSALYNEIRRQLDAMRVEMPPTSAVAGVYARVDRERGVWKAPANESLATVIGPTVRINDADQENMNVHTSGKSINAIRAFTGKGTLIWGARTLDGNSNEWRYVPVRRLFNFIEESVQKATAFAVFEPNTAMTWLKVSTMVENFLSDLWQRGALAGTKPEHAYFVSVGLGKTMTSQDILEGRLIVEIGIAAVRPAEFIIMRFSHKLQES